MKTLHATIFALAAVTATAGHALTLGELGARMAAAKCYADSATYEVLLPNLADPVVYSLSLRSAEAPGDTLAACKYLIGWQLPAPSGISEGFLAYFDGTHFRFRDSRLQEYHYEWTPEVFAPGGDTSRGVQTQAQFADLLPQNIGRHFIEMSADTSYIYKVTADTLVGGLASTVVEGERRANGYVGSEFLYVLEPSTLLPRRIEFENNPGQLGEQSITVVYAASPSDPECAIDENTLIALRPEAFEKYRESTFSLENLPGSPMPRIVSRMNTGERYSHERGEAFTAPTAFVFLDASVASTPDVIAAVRSAVASLPSQLDVVWAFLNHRAEDVEAVMPAVEPGEYLLVGARGAARDCGVGQVTPVIVFASTAGNVADYIIGYNQDLPSLVIQKASIASQQ